MHGFETEEFGILQSRDPRAAIKTLPPARQTMRRPSYEKSERRCDMCVRFALFASGDEIAQRFHLPEAPVLDPRYNIAPTQTIGAVRATDNGRELRRLCWGLNPSWASAPKVGYKLINARAETVRSAFRERRCLIPASAYYEWKRGTGRGKQPYCIRLRDENLFAFASMWERWQRPKAEAIEFCTLLTTEANELIQPIRDRMPVILDSEAENEWLNPRASTEELRTMLRPFPANRMKAYPVDPYVNNAKNQGPRCIEAVA
jgi:putative SOS response-associated peptidase YedK